MDIVIIGGGLAAAKAAVALRENGHTGALTIVAEEDHLPYERPPLSKDYLQGEGSFDDAVVQPQAWYEENDVRLVTGTRAERIDLAQHRVNLAGGSVLPYDKLVIATGARPRTLGVPGGEGARVLRSKEDSDTLREDFAGASSVVIVGGGWIGLEAAAAARSAGLETIVLESAEQPLQKVLGDELAGYFADLHRSHGVDVRTSVSVGAVSGTGPYVVRVGDDVLEADIVVAGVGAQPNTELAEEAGLLVEDGIVTDEHFTTADPDVLAIGDVAQVLNTTLGQALRVEHWDNASRQGEAVAKVLLGEDVSYDWLPFFWSDQHDLGMEYVGHGSAEDDVVVRGDKAEGEFIVFWLDSDRVTAAMNVNIWDVNDDLRALVGRTVDRERLADPGIELADLAGGS